MPRVSARTRAIRAVHAEARSRGIDDEMRRGIQRDVVGVDSCKDMSVQQLRQVVDALKGRRGHLSVVSDQAADASQPKMLTKIRAMQHSAGLTDAYANGISRRMYKRPIAQLGPSQLRGVIAALDRHIRQHRHESG